MRRDYFVARGSDKSTQQLLLLFHGVGDNPVTMGEVGFWFVPLFPDVLAVSIGGAEPYGTTSGRQWLSVQGVTEENHQECVDAIMPVFTKTVCYRQKQNGVSSQATVLIGFSRGLIMPLKNIKVEPGLASWAITFNGRYATLPKAATIATTVHLIHGDEDRVIESSHVVATQEALIRVGGDVTLDVVESLGHAIDGRSMQFALDRLHFTVPKYYFGGALSGGKPCDDDMITVI